MKINGTHPDGTYVSDWEYIEGKGDLDACNGIMIGGEYSYFITNDYPYGPRCMNGEYEESFPSGGKMQGPLPGSMGPPPRR